MNTVCYDLASLNRTQLELKRCPYCQSTLHSREAGPSAASQTFQQQASRPVVSTYIFECSHCAWWALREQRQDQALYAPLVADLIVMDAFREEPLKPRKPLPKSAKAPWERALSDVSCWANIELTPPVEAVQLFGTAQMLLPDMAGVSGKAVFNKLKSLAPVLIPILLIILIALIGTFS